MPDDPPSITRELAEAMLRSLRAEIHGTVTHPAAALARHAMLCVVLDDEMERRPQVYAAALAEFWRGFEETFGKGVAIAEGRTATGTRLGQHDGPPPRAASHRFYGEGSTARIEIVRFHGQADRADLLARALLGPRYPMFSEPHFGPGAGCLLWCVSLYLASWRGSIPQPVRNVPLRIGEPHTPPIASAEDFAEWSARSRPFPPGFYFLYFEDDIRSVTCDAIDAVLRMASQPRHYDDEATEKVIALYLAGASTGEIVAAVNRDWPKYRATSSNIYKRMDSYCKAREWDPIPRKTRGGKRKPG